MDHIEVLKQRFVEGDLFPQSLGISIEEVQTGYARVGMMVGEQHKNFHGIGHGGAIYTLADTAFALACNSHGPAAVALTVNMDYHAPARIGERLTATAREKNRTRKTGVCEIEVANEAGTLIATMRGIVYIKG